MKNIHITGIVLFLWSAIITGAEQDRNQNLIMLLQKFQKYYPEWINSRQQNILCFDDLWHDPVIKIINKKSLYTAKRTHDYLRLIFCVKKQNIGSTTEYIGKTFVLDESNNTIRCYFDNNCNGDCDCGLPRMILEKYADSINFEDYCYRPPIKGHTNSSAGSVQP